MKDSRTDQMRQRSYPRPPLHHKCAWVRMPHDPTLPHPPSCSSRRGKKTVHTSPPTTAWSHSALARSPAVNWDWGSVWSYWWRSCLPIKDSLTDNAKRPQDASKSSGTQRVNKPAGKSVRRPWGGLSAQAVGRYNVVALIWNRRVTERTGSLVIDCDGQNDLCWFKWDINPTKSPPSLQV